MQGSDRAAGLKTLAAFLAAVAILVTAAGYALRREWPWRPAPLETPTISEVLTERLDTLRRGETLSDLFSRNGLSGFALSANSPEGLVEPRKLRPGLVFSFQTVGDDSVPSRVVFRSGPEQRIALEPVADGWQAFSEAIAWRTEVVSLSGQITSSLYDALNQASDDSVLSPADRVRLAWDLADVFAWQVDFARDIRPGDSYRVVAERLVTEDGERRYGRVLAGDLVIGGQRYTGYRWTGPDGTTGFYDVDGLSLRRAFLLAPVQFRRISSRINRARLHPILGIVRRHEGIDYAADPGTEVMAAGDGVVLRRGWSGGYGNLVELRHANGITTRYGHLSRFAAGLSVGSRVSQGQVIGYVGSTGLATGPHLHYEFRVNGVSKDPRNVDLGSGDPVPLAQRREFDDRRLALAALLTRSTPFYAMERGGAEPGIRPAAGASF